MKCMGQFFQQQSNGTSSNESDANLVHETARKSQPFDGHFAFSVLPSMLETEWIIDSRASSHICSNPELLYTTHQLEKPTVIYLPDGSSKSVAYAGKVRLTKDIVLNNVLYVREFTHNLLSVSQPVKTTDARCVFHPTHCVFQKSNTDQVIGIGRLKGSLYVMETILLKNYISFL